MFTKEQKEEVWKEILSPLRWEAGQIRFNYRRKNGKRTIQYLIKYDFHKKEFTCVAFFYPNKKRVWAHRRTSETEREILKKKMLGTIRRELKRLEKMKLAIEP